MDFLGKMVKQGCFALIAIKNRYFYFYKSSLFVGMVFRHFCLVIVDAH